MSVPDFQTLMLPVLKQLAAGGEQPPAAVREAVATALQLTPEDAIGLPLWSAGRLDAATRETWNACLMGLVLFPLVIPWRYVLATYGKEPGDRWRHQSPQARNARHSTVASSGSKEDTPSPAA